MKKIGRPTDYKPEYDDIAHRLCLLGHTNAELAVSFEVHEATVERWMELNPSFYQAVIDGRERADGRVVQALYKRALGTDKIPPDTRACELWLRNRQRKKWTVESERKNMQVTVTLNGARIDEGSSPTDDED